MTTTVKFQAEFEIGMELQGLTPSEKAKVIKHLTQQARATLKDSLAYLEISQEDKVFKTHKVKLNTFESAMV